jgi:hypothetical protein
MRGRSVFARKLILASGICLGLLGTSWGVPLAKQRVVTINGQKFLLKSKLKTVLDMDFHFGYDHTIGRAVSSDALKRVATKEGLTYTRITDPAKITSTELQKYNVIFANSVTYWAKPGMFPTVGRTAVQNFVENQGGGLWIMHGSGDTRQDPTGWTWYFAKAHPVLFSGHGSRIAAPIFADPSGKKNPVMEGLLPSPMSMTGEWHRFGRSIKAANSKAEVLIRMDYNTCELCMPTQYRFPSFGNGAEVSWVMPVGKGTVGFFSEGHDAVPMNEWKATNWDRYFMQMLYYLAGYTQTAVASAKMESPTGIADPDLEYSLDDRTVAFHDREVAVMIAEDGPHAASLFDVSGREIKSFKGRGPAEYRFDAALKGNRGVYVLRVTAGKQTVSKRYFLN